MCTISKGLLFTKLNFILLNPNWHTKTNGKNCPTFSSGEGEPFITRLGTIFILASSDQLVLGFGQVKGKAKVSGCTDGVHVWKRRWNEPYVSRQSIPGICQICSTPRQPSMTLSVITPRRSRPLRPGLRHRSRVWWWPNGLLSLHCN